LTPETRSNSSSSEQEEEEEEVRKLNLICLLLSFDSPNEIESADRPEDIEND
jgi:hypothetical protein